MELEDWNRIRRKAKAVRDSAWAMLREDREFSDAVAARHVMKAMSFLEKYALRMESLAHGGPGRREGFPLCE